MKSCKCWDWDILLSLPSQGLFEQRKPVSSSDRGPTGPIVNIEMKIWKTFLLKIKQIISQHIVMPSIERDSLYPDWRWQGLDQIWAPSRIHLLVTHFIPSIVGQAPCMANLSLVPSDLRLYQNKTLPWVIGFTFLSDLLHERELWRTCLGLAATPRLGNAVYPPVTKSDEAPSRWGQLTFHVTEVGDGCGYPVAHPGPVRPDGLGVQDLEVIKMLGQERKDYLGLWLEALTGR